MSNSYLKVVDVTTGTEFEATKAFMDIVNVTEPSRYIVLEGKSHSRSKNINTTDTVQSANKPPKSSKKVTLKESEEISSVVESVIDFKSMGIGDEGGMLTDDNADSF